MAIIKARGQEIDVTEQVNLVVQFKDMVGNPIDTDTYPKISIVQPSGGVFLAPTSVGVSKVSQGKYSYILTIPYAGPYGVWNDVWTGFINGQRVETTFSFVVNHSQIPSVNTDGYRHLGDDPGFNYSQQAIKNINFLIKALKARLNSSGKAKAKDQWGNTVYVDCDIYSVDMLVSFLAMALWEFNQIPHFTSFQFDDDAFIQQFGAILVDGATLVALASMALLERGREYNISDNGISFTPPTVSELLNTQYSTLLTNYWEKLKYIKASMKPAPLGLGTWSATGGGYNTAYARLRHLRAGRLY